MPLVAAAARTAGTCPTVSYQSRWAASLGFSGAPGDSQPRFTVFGGVRRDGLAYYGIPVYGEVAVKASLDGAGPAVTPQTRTDAADPQRVEQVRGFLERYLPRAVGPELRTRVCCYDLPPDRDFITDYVPGSARVLVCAEPGTLASSPRCSGGS